MTSLHIDVLLTRYHIILCQNLSISVKAQGKLFAKYFLILSKFIDDANLEHL